MKKRGFFFVALGLSAAISAYAANQNYTDLGTAQTITVTEDKLSDAQVNTGSYVTVITREQVEAYHAESTADLLRKAVGVDSNAKGTLGAIQSISIRGMQSARTLVYIDGVPVNNAQQPSFDFTTIPVASIDHIEIIKSGSGNLGKAVAIGGIINIVTKSGSSSENNPHYELSFENGSYMPLRYTDGTEHDRNWRGMLDSQTGDFSYTDSFGKINLFVNAGATYADNGYNYMKGDVRYKRENNSFYEFHGNVNVEGKLLNDSATFSSKNLISWQHTDIPGNITNPSIEAQQKTFTISTRNTFSYDIFDIGLNYMYTPYWFEEYSPYYSRTTKTQYNNHVLSASLAEHLSLGANSKLNLGTEIQGYILTDHDNNQIGDKNRWMPKAYVEGSIYFMNGKLGIFPMASIAYLSDFDAASPEANLGITYQLSMPWSLSANFGYAENYPSFNQLYYPGYGNKNLDPEKSINGEIGVSYSNEKCSYSGSIYAKYMYDAFLDKFDPITYIGGPQNLARSAYMGMEQSVAFSPVDNLTLTAAYYYNKSFVLKDENTTYDLGDEVPVPYTREHMGSFGMTYRFDIFSFNFNGNLYGQAAKGTYDFAPVNAFALVNCSLDAQVSQALNVYAAIDNLFDTSYAFAENYPMPGMKIRLGGSWKF